MAAVGSIAGVAVALAAFAYDGSQPVNVVRLLALLVGVQLVLLVFTLLLLPGRVPGLRHVQDLLTALNPGAWAAGVFRKLAHASPDVARLFDVRAARPARGASRNGSSSTGRKRPRSCSTSRRSSRRSCS